MTVIAHGFELTGAANISWENEMAIAVAARAGGFAPDGPVAWYSAIIGPGSGPLGVKLQSFDRQPFNYNGHVALTPTADTASSGETVVTVNWSSVASPFNATSFGVGTDQVAAALIPVLINAIPAIGISNPLAELPVHLIGHSRGASLLTDIAARLGQAGAWVDQVTTLDPHPIPGDFADPNYPGNPFPPYNGERVLLTNNVVFADNYYETSNTNLEQLDTTGSYLDGAKYKDLSSFKGIDHETVHTYYHGTIDRGVTSDPDAGTVLDSWYDNQTRATTGFNYSLLAGGSRPSEGLSSLAGQQFNAYRTPDPVTSTDPWSNIGSLSISGDTSGVIANGSEIDLNYRYQNINPGGSIAFFLDDDTNPYDGFIGSHPLIARTDVPSTGDAPNAASDALQYTWSSTGLGTGIYHIYAQIISAGGNVRYEYLPQPLYVTADGAEIITKQWTGDVNSDWSDPRNWTPGGVPGPGDRVTIQLSADHHVDLNSGDSAADTHLLSGTVNWTAGAIAGELSVGPGAALVVSGPGEKDIYGTLDNAGTVTQLGTATVLLLSGGNPTRLNNLATGVYDIQGDGGLLVPDDSRYDVNDAVTNAGTFRKSGGSGQFTCSFRLPFSNTGTVESDSGTLTLAGGGSSTGGRFLFSNGGIVQLGGSTFDLHGANTASGNGALGVVGAVRAPGGEAATIDVADGAVLVLGGGRLYADAGGTLNLGMSGSGGGQLVAGGAIGGDGITRLVSGTVSWTGGQVAGELSVGPGAALVVSGPGEKDIYGTLDNAGTVTQLGTATVLLLSGGNPTRLNNLATGVYDIQGDGGLLVPDDSRYDVNDAVTNAGTFRKSGGSGQFTCSFRLPFSNTGTVESDSGTLTVGGAVAQVISGALTGGTWIIGANASITLTSVGQISANSATVMLKGRNATFPNLNTINSNAGDLVISGGAALALPASLASTGAIEVSGGGSLSLQGAVTGAGALTVGDGGAVSLGQAGQPATTVIRSLSVTGSAKLALGHDSLQVAYGAGPDPVAAIRDYVARGSITSAADASHALAVVDSADGVVPGLPANTVAVQPARRGDANLDSKIDFADLLILAQNYGRGSRNWDQGDFNGDGAVGFPDLLILAQNYGRSLDGSPSATKRARRRR